MRFPSRVSARTGVLVAALTMLLAACGGGGGGSAPAPAPQVLRATGSQELTAYLREALGPSSVQYMYAGVSDAAATVPGAAAAEAGPGFSGTTLQEVGVDEDDLIKSDGVAVFSLDAASGTRRTTLRRQRLDAAAANAALTPVDSFALPFSPSIGGTGLYLDEERRQAVAIGQTAMWGMYQSSFAPSQWAQGATELVFVSTSGATALQLSHRLQIAAQLVGSRRIGSTLYLVLRSYPQLPGFDPWWQAPNVPKNQAIVASLQAQDALPTIATDGGAPQPLVAASSCLLQDANAAKTADIVTIAAIDLATARTTALCFAGRTEAVYLSPANLYLATTRNNYVLANGRPVYAPGTTTDIHKFALDASSIAYRGSGSVPGHLGFDQDRKSFRLGEDQGSLRVATQTRETFPMVAVGPPAPGVPAATTGTATATESPAHLAILQERDGALVTVGELPNAKRPEPLGKPGESLYASRFIGARGYLVTYRLTDPLYVLDLSDPQDPKVAGQLQVSGYSDALFPLSETLLLGVGKDAAVDGTAGDGRFAWYQGVKVSLIDVSDPANPREAARQVIGHRGTSATVLTQHHGIAIAIATAGGRARIALPVNLHDSPPAVATGRPNDYWTFTRTELQRFEVDLGSAQLTPMAPLATNVTTPGERWIENDRALLWGDQVHWYQDGAWRSAGW